MARPMFAACIGAVMLTGTGVAGAQGFGSLDCTDLKIEGDGTYNPVVVINNSCSTVVFWRLCVNYTARLEREYFEGALGAGESARITTYPAEGEEFYVGATVQTGSDLVDEPEC